MPQAYLETLKIKKMQNKLAIDLLKKRLISLQSTYKEGTSGHNCFGIAANICDEYTKEEKEHIVNAFTAGQIDIIETLHQECIERKMQIEFTLDSEDNEDGLEYFNNNFNQHH